MTAEKIQLPDMPNPRDFGLTEEGWSTFAGRLAYYRALDAWKEAAKLASGKLDDSDSS